MQQRLQDAVASLEALRLGLLRLHAGSMTVDGFTTHLGVAEELSADVARLVAAQTEVQQFLVPQYRAPAIADDVTLTPA